MDENLYNTEPVECKLQYRVLPNKEWTTVAKRTFQPKTIPENALPAFYLGRNNINPTQIKKGDIIMIRLFVQRGMINSGEESDLCIEKLIDNKTKFPDNYQYTADDTTNSTEFDLGGKWLPQYVMTVKFSGKYRPVR